MFAASCQDVADRPSQQATTQPVPHHVRIRLFHAFMEGMYVAFTAELQAMQALWIAATRFEHHVCHHTAGTAPCRRELSQKLQP